MLFAANSSAIWPVWFLAVEQCWTNQQTNYNSHPWWGKNYRNILWYFEISGLTCRRRRIWWMCWVNQSIGSITAVWFASTTLFVCCTPAPPPSVGEGHVERRDWQTLRLSRVQRQIYTECGYKYHSVQIDAIIRAMVDFHSLANPPMKDKKFVPTWMLQFPKLKHYWHLDQYLGCHSKLQTNLLLNSKRQQRTYEQLMQLVYCLDSVKCKDDFCTPLNPSSEFMSNMSA